MGLWGIIPLMEVRDEFSGKAVGWGGDRRYRHSGQR